MDLDAMAAAMYPAHAPTPQPAATPATLTTTGEQPPQAQPEAQPSLAERLYGAKEEQPKPAAEQPAAETKSDAPTDGAIPDAVKELRAEVDRRIYSAEKTHGLAISTDDINVEGLAPEIKTVAITEFREMFADHGLSVNESREVVTLFHQPPPSPAVEAQWQQEARQQLIEAHGSVEGANAALKAARQLVARDPRVARLLDESRLGSHPRLVALLVQKAQEQLVMGKLK